MDLKGLGRGWGQGLSLGCKYLKGFDVEAINTTYRCTVSRIFADRAKHLLASFVGGRMLTKLA